MTASWPRFNSFPGVEVPATDAAEFRRLEDAIANDEKGMVVLKKLPEGTLHRVAAGGIH